MKLKQLFPLLFLLCVMALCAPALAQTFTTPYYTITIPDTWEIDTEDLSKEDDYEGLGYLIGPESVDLVIEAAIIYYEDLQDVSLWKSDEDEMEAYVETVLSVLEDDNPEYVDTVMAGPIPFVLVSAADDDGPYCYADTMTNGYSVLFVAYVEEDGKKGTLPMTETTMETFRKILESFKPVI